MVIGVSAVLWGIGLDIILLNTEGRRVTLFLDLCLLCHRQNRSTSMIPNATTPAIVTPAMNPALLLELELVGALLLVMLILFN